jgi:peptidyl-prolyl cis-trans isomerase C
LAVGRAPSAAGTAPDDRSAAVATFDGGKVTVQELSAAIEEQGPMVRETFAAPEARRRLATELARRKIIEAEAVKKGYDRAPELVRERSRALVGLYLKKEFVEPESKLAASESELAAFLEKHKAEYERPERVRVADLFLAAPSQDAGARRKRAVEARALLDKAKAQAGDYYAFASLVREHSDDAATRPFGGELPPLGSDELAARLGKEVAEAALALRGNEALADHVIETSRGFHLLKLRAREEAQHADLARVREAVRARLLAERRRSDEDAFNRRLEEQAHLKIDDAVLSTPVATGEARASR